MVRARLLERLEPEAGTKLVVVAAPAGSGKTTLLGAWREVEAVRRPVGWVSLDVRDNDPVVLWSHVLEALRRVCRALDVRRRPDVVGAAGLVDLLQELVNQLFEQGDVALVLDDFHLLADGQSRDSVTWLVEHAPPSFQLIVATRRDPGLPMAAFRAHGELRELRAVELAFTADEAELLLNGHARLGLSRDDVDSLVARTEGWPAGLYLAALSLRGAPDRHAFVSTYGATNPHVVDFLVEEVLEAHDAAQQELMLYGSVLERLSGPLCDAVLEREGSDRQLRQLSRTNLFLLPLDDHGQWYRFHHLFAHLLRVELRHREPAVLSTLHRRAFAWHREYGSIDEAVEHGLAGSLAETSDLIATSWMDYVNLARYETILSWLDRLPADVLDAHGSLLLGKAWVLSLSGRREEAADAITAAERLVGLGDGPLLDGASSVEAGLATLRATIPWGDVGAGYANALRAAELESPESPYWPIVCWALGMGHFYRGELAEAERWFTEAAESAPALEAWQIASSARSYRSFIAGEQGDIDRQSLFAQEALQIARERGIEEVVECHTAVGASLAAQARFEEARALLERGAGVGRKFGQPIDLTNVLLRLIPVLRALGDSESAASVIAEARALVDSCPDPGILAERLQVLEHPPRTPPRPGAELSERELVVLRMLNGPLSARQIGRELYLSHNTINSHTRSIYRKLGVTSRDQALRRARELGLV